MLRSIDPTTDAFLTALKRVSSRIDRAQTQIASGKRMTTISDDASGITPLLEARAGIGATKQIQANLGYLKTEVDGAEQSLAAATKLMDRVRVLGAQGNTSTATAEQRTHTRRGSRVAARAARRYQRNQHSGTLSFLGRQRP